MPNGKAQTKTTRRSNREPTPAQRRLMRRMKRFGVTLPNVDYVYHPSFSLPAAERKFWGDERTDIPVPRYNLLPEVAEEMPHAPPARSTLAPDEEKELFLRYNYAKYRLRKLLDASARATSARRRQVALWERRARTTRSQIVHANLPLVPSMAKRSRAGEVEFTELISEGYMAVLRSVEKFDVSRGFKFSTYACRAILSSFHRLASKTQTKRKRINAQYDPNMEESDYNERRHAEQRGDAIETVREALRRNAADLTPVERTVIEKRFPVLGRGAPQTLRQVGRSVGLSNERVRQIERQSLTKIRDAIEEHFAA
ncbi:MAG: sigma-70 family RNA polymerase sigma factor [Phycisphaerae bacterium]|nr:sigma-70 family RNA polymerase sigma factor [Phycisphaerae bacterium]